jgi:hypothetical protein
VLVGAADAVSVEDVLVLLGCAAEAVLVAALEDVVVDDVAVVEEEPLVAVCAAWPLTAPTPTAPAMTAVAVVAPTAIRRITRRANREPSSRRSPGVPRGVRSLLMSAPFRWGLHQVSGLL